MIARTRMHGLVAALVVAATLAFAGTAHATHFRYGTIKWRVDATNPRLVTFQVEAAWRASYFGNPVVNGVIDTGLPFTFGDNTAAQDLTMTVTAVNASEDWITATKQFTHTYSSTGTFLAQFTGCCRLSSLADNNHDTTFTISSQVKLDGTTNIASPVSANLPIMYAQIGTPTTFLIAAFDPSGLPLTYAFSSPAESGLTNNPPTPTGNPPKGMTVNATTGDVSWTPTALGLYAVQLKVSNAHGTVPLDFLVSVVNAIPGHPPTLTINGSATPPTFHTKVGDTLTFALDATDPDVASDGGPSQLTLYSGSLPTGSAVSPSLPTIGRSPLHATFSWTPTVAQLGGNALVFSVRDDTGHVVTANAEIVVGPSQPPQLVCGPAVTVEATGPAGASASASATAQDANALPLSIDWSVNGVLVRNDSLTATATPTTVTLTQSFPLGNNAVDVSASDNFGETVSCHTGVVVRDTTPPALSGLPADQVVEATSAAGAVADWAPPAAQDLVSGSVAVTCTPPSGSLFALGTTTVTCSANDAAGNHASASFNVVVRDTTPPDLFGVPADLHAEATSAAGAVVGWAAPSSLDVVDGPVPVLCTPSAGSTFPLGATAVTCTATDHAGNARSSTFHVVVQDTTPPLLSGLADRVAEATGPAGAAVAWPAPTATDTVSGNLPVTCAPASGATFALGTTTVTCSASDAAGNTTSASFQVLVRDTTPPLLSGLSDRTVEATSISGTPVSWPAPTAVDAVSGNVPVSCTPASGASFPLGTSSVTCSASDAAGNRASGTFVVTVQDTSPPVISGVTTDPTSLWPPNHKMVAVTVGVSFSDVDPHASCAITSVTANEPITGPGSGNTSPDWTLVSPLVVDLRAERTGTGDGRIYTLGVTCSDSAGNASTTSTTVAVAHNQ